MIGNTSLSNLTTTNYNVAVGYQAGDVTSTFSANTTPAQSIFIGASTRSSADNNTNEIVIGYDAVGNGSNTATYGNSSLTDHYFSGAIRTSAPSGGSQKKWKLGEVSTTTPTSPNRTIRVEIDGVVYYIHAKTTND
jgi:hypothetical protein